MRQAWDDAALESLPLKLIVVSIVGVLSILPAARALESFENREFLIRAEIQLNEIVAEAQRLSINGPGNVRTLSIDLYSKSAVRFSRLALGDKFGGSNMSSAILELSNGARMVCLAEDCSLWICSPSRCTLLLTSPIVDLRLECILATSLPCVIIEVV